MLESFFSMERAFGRPSNTTPSPIKFRYRIRLLILGAKVRSPKGTNCEIEDLNYLARNIIWKLKLPNPNHQALPLKMPHQPSTFELLQTKSFTTDTEALRYLAGYLAWQLKRKKGIYGIPSKFATFPDWSLIWIQHLSRGGLLVPNDDIFITVLNCEKVFLEFTKTHFMKDKIKFKCQVSILAYFPSSNMDRVPIYASYLNQNVSNHFGRIDPTRIHPI